MALVTQLYRRLAPSAVLSGENKVARYLARQLLEDMKRTVDDKTYSPAPFIAFERHFGQSSLHIQRFQNYIAETGILRQLLGADWFKTLPEGTVEPVTRLFGRVIYTDNVQRSIQNRPQYLSRIDDILNPKPAHLYQAEAAGLSADAEMNPAFDGDFEDLSHLEDDFELPESVTTTAQPRKKQRAKLPSLDIGVQPRRYDRTAPSNPVNQIVVAIEKALENGTPFPKPELLLNALPAAAKPRANPADLPRLLSAFETAYGMNENALGDLDAALFALPVAQRPNRNWIDTIYFDDRVLVAALFRRLSQRGGEFAKWIDEADLSEQIVISNQDHVAQLTGADHVEQEETILFRKILSGEIDRSGNVIAANTEDELGSEDALKAAGWYKIIGGPDWQMTEMLRLRQYETVKRFGQNPENFDRLSALGRMYLAAAAAYLGRPISRRTAKAFPGIPRDLVTGHGQRAPELKASAEKVLFRRELANPSESPRAIWFNLQNAALAKDAAALRDGFNALDKFYGEQKLNLVRDRQISFDTFLITELPRILSMANAERLWPEMNSATLIACTYSAIAVQQSALLPRLVLEMKARRDIPGNLFVPLLQAYQQVGFHTVDAFLSNTSHKDIDLHPFFTRFDAKEKVLVLIEDAAQLKALDELTGKPKRMDCVPVQAIQVANAPSYANVTQIDDEVRTYGEEDAHISKIADDITTALISEAQNQLSAAGFDKLTVACTEVAHANLFYPLYFNAVNLHIAQKYVAKAKDYDRVLVLMHNGRNFAPLIPDLIDAVGRENVHITVRGDRRDITMSALNAVRAQFDAAPIGRERPFEKNWAPGLKKWLKETRKAYNSDEYSAAKSPYAVACFEHINGYGDSYKALVNENLKYGDVELVISVANKNLQNFISEGGFDEPPAGQTADHWGQLRQFAPHGRPEVALSWVPGLIEEVAQKALADMSSPLFPTWKEAFSKNGADYLGLRLPRIFDAMVYFQTRFAKKLPTHIMTGPNQHIISRAASYVGQDLGVPVYDFLILANTDHPRYRPPVADTVYLYDGWYKDIYRNFFGLKASQLRVSGPLFNYADRLKTNMEGYEKTDGLSDIVIFSQSANFENSKQMLTAICEQIKDRTDVALTVKLHPHESIGNIERFTQIAKAAGVTKNLRVIKDGDAVALVNMADVVVQSYSNVGLDAFLLGKPVITFKPKLNLTSRIFLYEKEIGKEVKTPDALGKAVIKQLDSKAAQKTMAQKAEAFAKENAHFLRADNARRVVQQIQKDLQKKTKK